MTIQRSWVTPITAGSFLLVGVTGILIFFHIDSGANKFVHEWLSWVLLGGALLHTTANFNGFKMHLGKPLGRTLIGVFAIALALSFIPLGGGKSEPPFMAPVRALGESDLVTLAQVAQVTPVQLRERLAKAGVQASSDQQTLAELVGPDVRQQMNILGRVFKPIE